jgi:hypothetical protein
MGRDGEGERREDGGEENGGEKKVGMGDGGKKKAAPE